MPRRFAALHSALILLLIVCTASVVDAAPDPLKVSRKCRKTIATETAKLVKTAQKLVDRCHAARVKGKSVGDCNAISGADTKGVLPKAEAKATAKIDKVCAAGEPVRVNFPGGAVGAGVALGVHAAVDASASALQGAADLAASKAGQKCHTAIGKARSTIVDAIVKAAVKCQLGLDKAATTFDALDTACIGAAADVANKATVKIQKACTPKDAPPLTGADVGSCDPLPACVVTQATATGQGLATLAFFKASTCGDGFLDAARGEACPLLEGAPEAPALAATHDMDAGVGVPKTEISLDAAGLEVARTQLEIAFVATATIGEVNGVLTALNGEIVSMLQGVLILVVRIPDPGSLPAVDSIVADLEANPLVRSAEPGTFDDEALLPTNVPSGSGDLSKIDHHLAVRAHAAWNARAALVPVQRPIAIVADFYGDGFSNADVDRNDVAGTPGVGAANAHGYHVLGIVAASLDGAVSDRGLATGMYPATSRIGYVDYILDAVTKRTAAQFENLILATVRSTPGNAVVNTSIQFMCETPVQVAANCNAATAETKALGWIEKVRGTVTGAASLEGAFLQITAAGNADVATDLDATVGSKFGAARLLGGLDVAGVPVANLTNVLVVENVLNTVAEPFRSTCLNKNSKRPGNLAGIGTDVWSLKDAATVAGELSGTSMAAPQVAGLAAYVWALAPELTPQAVAELLRVTGRAAGPSIGDARCDLAAPSPVIDAYAAVLATDDGGDTRVRRAVLDVADGAGAPGTNGAFDERDVDVFISQLDTAAGAVDYSRYDLNGDGATGGDDTDRFDLTIDAPPAYTTLSIPIRTVGVTFNEAALTDFEVLCFYAYSPLYTGDAQVRDDLLTECVPEDCPKIRTGGRISVSELPACTNNFSDTGLLPTSFDVEQTCPIGGQTFTTTAEVIGGITTGSVDLLARREVIPGMTPMSFEASIAAGDFRIEEPITIDAPGMTGQQGIATASITIDGAMNASGPCNSGAGASGLWRLLGRVNGQFMFGDEAEGEASPCPVLKFIGPALVVGEPFTFTYGEPFDWDFRFDAQARAYGDLLAPNQATAVLSYSWGGLAGLAPGATVTSCSGVDWSVSAP